jgi:methylphosphotriester-DNA--protein-cysteine methyltransferase
MWAAFVGRDARYDGRFIVGVRSTGIFCRPVCMCRKPRRERAEYFPSPGAAPQAGYRPCKRCRPEPAGGRVEADRRFAERALAVMRARLDEPLTLADLAAAVASSPSAFVRRFRAAEGRTPTRALADLRVERAEALLRDVRLTVLEAGFTAGFGSLSAFARAFRRRTGRAPARWRASRNDDAGRWRVEEGRP